MPEAEMYSRKDRKRMTFHIECKPSKDACEKCPLKRNCDKKIYKTELQYGSR